jgi:hypothetical protein
VGQGSVPIKGEAKEPRLPRRVAPDGNRSNKMARAIDEDRDELRRELKSGRFDPNTAHQPQEVRKHPTEGEKMQFGEAAPDLMPGDETILPDRGRPIGEASQHSETMPRSEVKPRSGGNQGVLDPAEDGHPLPEGLERKRAGPLNKTTGRRSARQV